MFYLLYGHVHYTILHNMIGPYKRGTVGTYAQFNVIFIV